MLFTLFKGRPARIQAVLAGVPLVRVAIILGASMWVARLI